jgi:hypothetical protein
MGLGSPSIGLASPSKGLDWEVTTSEKTGAQSLHMTEPSEPYFQDLLKSFQDFKHIVGVLESRALPSRSSSGVPKENEGAGAP